jgi:hypothetical protein
MSQEDMVIQGKSQTAAQKQPAARTKGDDDVWIMIPKTKDDFRDVYVCPNFTPYQIKRGVKVKVPATVVAALECAIGTTFLPDTDPITGRVTLIPQETMAVPFQLVQPA